MANHNEIASFIWSVADLIRGPYRPNQYKDVMLPLTVLRRLDCVLEPTKEKVLAAMKRHEGGAVTNLDPILNRAAGQSFHNKSLYTFEKLKGDPDHVAPNLVHFIKGFSFEARAIIEHFGFERQIEKLDKADRLFLLVQRFAEIDLHPNVVPNHQMGTIFEELIRRFNEASNEEAGDHFTPREVIRLMVNLLLAPDRDELSRTGIVRTLYDPASGTGGMLSVAEEYLRELNPDGTLEVFGQDYNDQAYAICGSDMLIKGQDPENVRFGNSFTEDRFPGQRFDYMLANPPFGVEWKPEADFIRKEHEEQKYDGRFGAGLPRINDGALLFLLHMISKMKPAEEGGTRLGIVFNGSPLFTGGAGSGESNIRRWIIENDWLDAIVALPDQLFYNTGISTYIWLVTNRKAAERRGKIQMIDAREHFVKMSRSLGNKRNQIGDGQEGRPNQIGEIVDLYRRFEEGEHVRIFDNENFGYRRITVDRPLQLSFAVTSERLQRVAASKAFQKLAESKKRKDGALIAAEEAEGRGLQQAILEALRGLEGRPPIKNREEFRRVLKSRFDESGLSVQTSLFKSIVSELSEHDDAADVCRDSRGAPEPDPNLRDTENVPLSEPIEIFFEREVAPHVPQAWIDEGKRDDKDGEVGIVGYEINFNRYFYTYEPPRPLEDIERDIKRIENEIMEMLREVAG